jgi:hypothetical protein
MCPARSSIARFSTNAPLSPCDARSARQRRLARSMQRSEVTSQRVDHPRIHLGSAQPCTYRKLD